MTKRVAKRKGPIFETLEDGEQQTHEMVIRNLAMLVRRLAYKHPNEKLKKQAEDYLFGEGLQGSPLRERGGK